MTNEQDRPVLLEEIEITPQMIEAAARKLAELEGPEGVRVEYAEAALEILLFALKVR